MSRSQPDEDAATELRLHIDNDSDCYFNHLVPVLKTLEKHFKRGNWSEEKAVIALERYALTPTAKSYAKQNCASQKDWCTVFTKPTRTLVAIELAEFWLAEFQLGNGFSK